jgi:hypothetical protein
MKKIIGCWPIFILFFVLIKGLMVTNDTKGILSKGETTKAYVFAKKKVGSKGTVTCFYRFSIGNLIYEGSDDTDTFNAGDSIIVKYLPNNPAINRSERFLKKRTGWFYR